MSADELARFNALPPALARDQLLACCNSQAWAGRMADGRPYSSATDAIRQSLAIVSGLMLPDLEAALAGHPRIGESPPGGESSAARAWSQREQSGVSESGAEIAAALAQSNVEYERRFGHIYLVCASGRSGAQLLELLRARLANHPDAEWQVVRTELQKINAIRLRDMLASAP